MKIADLILRLVISTIVIAAYYYLNFTYPIIGNILTHLLFFAAFFIITILFFRYGWKNGGYGILIGLFIAVGAAIIYVFTLLLENA
jgi:hypothetical protein